MIEQSYEVYIDQEAIDRAKKLMELLGEKEDRELAVKDGKTYHPAYYEYPTIEMLISELKRHGRSLDFYKVGISPFTDGLFAPWFPHDTHMYLKPLGNRKTLLSLALQVITLQEELHKNK